MSLQNSQVVDAIGIDILTGEVVLSIIDHLDWKEEKIHLLKVQAKLNLYFSFIESGQVLETYPESSGRAARIDIIGKHPLPDSARHLLKLTDQAAQPLNIKVNFRLTP